MSHALQPHPEFACEAVRTITVEVSRGAVLSLRYIVSGELAQLKRPEPRAPERAGELWESTCFEAFLRAPGHDEYLEFNFAPSRQWAAYRFTGYREGMRALTIAPPAIGVTADDSELVLHAEFDLEGISILPRGSSWWLGLSAVIEEINGRKSYWALKHPAGKPDFHHPDCFALELPPP